MESNQHPQFYREDLKEFFYSPDAPDDLAEEEKQHIIGLAVREQSGEVFFQGNANPYEPPIVQNLHLSRCYNCKKLSVWIHKRLSYPTFDHGFIPAENMPVGVRADFEEAAQVYGVSPRASAALLRVAIEKLCNEINRSDDRIFDGIGKLVEQGLSPKVQRALDFVRVTGNDAVHPGQIQKNDSREDAGHLFELVNIIVDELISTPKRIDELYDKIPESKRSAIEKRDRRATE